MGTDDPKIGEELPDGKVCAGISPRTGKNMYVNGRNGGDLGDMLTWDEAQVAMKNLAPFGWRLPAKSEMAGVRMVARWADEKDSDPFRRQRLHALFMRADSGPLATSEEASEVATRAGGRKPSPDELNSSASSGGPKTGGPGLWAAKPARHL
jgi:hypothetical protein